MTLSREALRAYSTKTRHQSVKPLIVRIFVSFDPKSFKRPVTYISDINGVLKTD
jgi:hypothetical protein